MEFVKLSKLGQKGLNISLSDFEIATKHQLSVQSLGVLKNHSDFKKASLKFWLRLTNFISKNSLAQLSFQPKIKTYPKVISITF